MLIEHLTNALTDDLTTALSTYIVGAAMLCIAVGLMVR